MECRLQHRCLITALPFGVKRHGQIYLQSVYGLLRELLHNILTNCFQTQHKYCLWCKLQSTLQITAMALVSKVDQNIILQWHVFNRGASYFVE